MKLVELGNLPWEGISHDPNVRKRVAVRKGEVPHVTQYAQVTFEPGQMAAAHAHRDMWELFVCVAGNGTITIDSKILPLVPGTCVTVDPGEVHEVTNDGAADLVINVLGIVD